MFTVSTNRDIKMNQCDNAQFPLFLNNGTKAGYQRYEFEKDDGCEVYFYLLPPHAALDAYVLKKTFCTNGDVIVEKPGCQPYTYHNETNINDNKDIVISLLSEDTKKLHHDSYTYLIRAKVLTDKIKSTNIIKSTSNPYTTLQVTNRYNFYLIKDDVNRAW